MKTRWKLVVEGESAGTNDVKWLLWIITVVTLIAMLVGLGHEVVVYWW